ncbi:MAG: type I 3-dehydroquinate dehydratase [Planctomycetes bacterium]|nr:type I 3-dehydroquinate dehydratase [Planctomycetota bacterium]
MTSAARGAGAARSFPLRGIAAVVDGPAAMDVLLGESPPRAGSGIELRADLFAGAGEAIQALSRLREERPGLPVLFTLRLAAQGGGYRGGDAERLAVYRLALDAGAALLDAEWGSEAARSLLREDAPLVLSHHDFTGMPAPEELRGITSEMESSRPAAVKVVPTARTLLDGALMLRWLEEREASAPARVGFAMGARGAASRILSIARGAPYTYGSLAGAVAPGQISAAELRHIYRASELSRAAPVFGLAGREGEIRTRDLALLNAALRRAGRAGVFVPLEADSIDDVVEAWDPLKLSGAVAMASLRDARRPA